MIYNLHSTQGVYTPGILRFCKDVYRSDPKYAMKIMRSYPGLPDEVSVAYLTGEINMTISDEIAVLEHKSQSELLEQVREELSEVANE